MTVLKTASPLQTPLLSPDIPSRKRKAPTLEPLMESKTALTEDRALSNAARIKKRKYSKQPEVAPRSRRKSRWKLKFHHQALPPEYLKHYKLQEKKRETENRKLEAERAASKKSSAGDQDGVDVNVAMAMPDILDDAYSPIDSPHSGGGSRGYTAPCPSSDSLPPLPSDISWPGFLSDSFPNLNIDPKKNKAFIENLLSNQIEINRVDRSAPKSPSLLKSSKQKKLKTIPSSGKIMNYSDLPYMGEITLDGVKPRRGRKPKKADICHLIYKNYGQVFPGSPGNNITPLNFQKAPAGLLGQSSALQVGKRPTSMPQAESPLPTVSGLLNHSQVQNRIINSLLERRLTQKERGKQETCAKPTEEPLNLCMKDLKSLKIKLSRKHGNIYVAKQPQEEMVEVKKEVVEVDSEESSVEDPDLAPFNLVTTELRDSEDDDSFSLGNQFSNLSSPEMIPDHATPLPPGDPMMFWPPNNFFYPPMPVIPVMPDMYDYLPNVTPNVTSPPEEKKLSKLRCKTSKRLTPKANCPASTFAKRKRSAIFIPPVPAENTTNPATEVSICKFKFTGGAKPSLQEKKMLSVDSGGNFRYYSGTGDKSMRGYEYFPRESLQQCQENTGCSPSGVFLTASALGSGEKIPEDIGHNGFFDPTFPLQVTPKLESSPKVDKRKMVSSFATDGDSLDDSDSDSSLPSPSCLNGNTRAGELDRGQPRKSRKSLAREKLEKTFKEKGFLIQTEQLESAEGATYCKFRQLRKFTRYLFRSWKDYLPGNVRDLSDTAGVAISDREAVSSPPTPTPPPQLRPTEI